MLDSTKPLAVVTGASSGIGFELARECARNGFNLIIAADEAEIAKAAGELRGEGIEVEAVEADLATTAGVDRLMERVDGRSVDALLANAGRGLGHAFLDQDFGDIRHVIDTNVTGTLDLVHRVGKAMRARGKGRILITGSIAGLMPGAYHAVYNASKAFLDSFAYALRAELKDTGVSVTCLMPGATETEFFERAGLEDTKLGQSSKAEPADVAKAGFKAMMAGDGDVVPGWQTKLASAIANIIPGETLAKVHARMAEPKGADSRPDFGVAQRNSGTGLTLQGHEPGAQGRPGTPARDPQEIHDMTAKYLGVAALAAVLLTGTSTFALAQTSGKSQQPSSADVQKAPSAPSGGMTTGASPESTSPSGKSTTEQSSPGKSTQSAPTKPQAQQNATKPSDKNAAQGASQPSGKNAAQSTSQPSGKSAQGSASKSNTSGSAPATGNANLTAQQKTVIKNKIIDNKSAPRVSHVNFNVSVGVAVPTTVHLAPLPEEIVHIHPAWRSYVYFVYEEEVIIVNPHTHKIIEIIRVS